MDNAILNQINHKLPKVWLLLPQCLQAGWCRGEGKTNHVDQNIDATQVNVDTGATIQKKLPTGLFPTEPIFVARPGAEDEDDGVVVMSGIDGAQEKGYVIVYNATDMEEIFRATAPRKTLFGVHSKFFSFTDGCWQPGGDCTPTSDPTSNPTTDPTTMTSDDGSCPEGWMDAGEMGCFYVSTELTVSSWYEANLLCEDLGGYLVEPMSEQIQLFLSTMLVMLPEVAGDLDWWIGLTDTGHEGTWAWAHQVKHGKVGSVDHTTL